MILFYVDEAGDPYLHHEPLLDGETPLFCLTAVAIEASRWRDLDRALFGLKRTYFLTKITSFAAAAPDRRPEHCEVKGHYLIKPSSAKIYRNRVFTHKVLQVLEEQQAKLFAAIWTKDAAAPVDPMAMYTHALQILTERFHHHCLAMGQQGIIIVDSRTKALDFRVAAGHLSFLFGHELGKTYRTMIEGPLFAESSLSAGVQVADIVGACVYGNYYARRCAGIPGYYLGDSPVSVAKILSIPPGSLTTRTPARDYSHCRAYWPALDRLQFRRTDVGAPTIGGPTVSGFYGFREIRGRGTTLRDRWSPL